MTEQHTQLPWAISGKDGRGIISVAVGNSCGIAYFFSSPEVRVFDPFEARANAKFAVRACNSFDGLLEACGKLANLAEVVALCVGTWTPEHQALARKYAIVARAAIKKAQGETE